MKGLFSYWISFLCIFLIPVLAFCPAKSARSGSNQGPLPVNVTTLLDYAEAWKVPVSANSKGRVDAAEPGRPGRQEGRQLRVDFRGDHEIAQAMQGAKAEPRSLAAGDLNSDAAPDVVAGYAFGSMGIVTVQLGNTDAFAPKDDSVFARMQQGYDPASLTSTVRTYQIPEPGDFVQVGDFNNDNRKDVLVAARGGDLFLLAGDGNGKLGAPGQINLPGSVTALASGEFRAFDGKPDVAVAVNGPGGPLLLIFDGAANGLAGTPMQLPLAGEATAVQFGPLDNDPFMDLAVAAGSQIEIVHGWGRKQNLSLQSRVELINAGVGVRGLDIGFFVWNREGSNELALLTDAGTISVLQRGEQNETPFSDQELAARTRNARAIEERKAVDIEKVQSWQQNDTTRWTTAREITSPAVPGSDGRSVFRRSHISPLETDDLLVAGGGRGLQVVCQTVSEPQTIRTGGGILQTSEPRPRDLAIASLNTTNSPVAVLALPQKLNGERELVMLQKQSAQPTMVSILPTATIAVDRFDDPSGAALTAASACTGAANDCSLRGSVQFANANPGTVINLSTATYVLSIDGANGCVNEPLATGNTIGDLEVNTSTTFVGTGAGNTIIRQAAATNDRVLCMDVSLAPGLTFAFSGLTITGGRDVNSNVGGGGFIGGARNTTLTLTNVTFANNQTTGPNISGGGGVAVTGGDMTVTSCTFGAANNPGANRNDLTLGNASNSNSGGGLSYSPGDPLGVGGATGTLTVTGATFTHNTSSSGSAGGGGIDLFNFNTSTGTANISTSSFTNNQATGTASGGGINNESLTNVSISTTSFTSNSAGNRGGAIYVGGGSLLLDGTGPSITFTGNTATTAGSSISTASAVNVAGANTIIGGDIEVTTNAVWTNNTGSALAPTNVSIVGGTFTCNNSTMNVGGDLSIVAGAVVGGVFNAGTGTVNLAGNFSFTGGGSPAGAFNAGTGLFNFNGSGAQSIGGGTAATFNNLTVNKPSGALTLGINAPVAGNLNVSAGTFDLSSFTANRTVAGGTLTVANGATLKIGSTGTLPSNFSTHSIGATSTIEYSGTNQSVATLNSGQVYGNLTISGSGTKTLAGPTTVAGNVTLTAGTLDVSASNFAMNVSGNWTNNGGALTPRAGTVTFNSTTAAQSINGTAASQTFNNVTVSKSGQTLSVAGSTTTLTLNGGMLLSAGTFSAGTATTINVAGDWTNNGGSFTPGSGTVAFNNTASAQSINGTATTQTFNGITVAKTAQTLSVGGSTTSLTANGTVTLTSGTFSAGTAAAISVAGNWTNNGGTFTPGAGTVTFNGGGAQTIGGTAVSQTFNNVTVNKGGGTLSAGGSTTTLSVKSLLLTLGTFSSGTAANINVGGDWTRNGGAFTGGSGTVTFNGSALQTIGGSTSTTFNSLTVNNASGVTVGLDQTVGGALTLTSGALAIGSNTLTLNGATAATAGSLTVNTNGTVVYGQSSNGQTVLAANYGNLTLSDFTKTLPAAGTVRIAGTFTTGSTGGHTVTGSTVEFNGASAQTMPSGFTLYNNLTINNGAGVALGGNATVNGVLTLTSGDLDTSPSFTLTMPASGSSAGTTDVVGNVKRTGFVVAGPALSFGNPFNSIQILSGTVPTDINVNLVRAAPADFAAAVNRKYTITPNGGSGISAKVRLHYLDSELNGNTEGAGLHLFRFDGTAWQREDQTANDTINNWAERSGVTTFSPWTLNSTESNPQEASSPALPMTATKGAGTSVNLSFTAACGATNHAVYWGTGPISVSVSWTNSACSLGTGPAATFDPGNPAAGAFFYWVIVGQTVLREGSYGHNGSAQEIPEAIGVGACDRPQVLSAVCP